MKFIEVYLEDAFLFQETLTYACEQEVSVGMRVWVPLRNRKRMAFVVSVQDPYPVDFKVQHVIKVIDNKPILNKELMLLAEKMAYYYVAPTIRCYQTILPNKLQPKSSAEKAKKIRMVRLKQKCEGQTQRSLGPKQKEFMVWMKTQKECTYQQARSQYAGIRSLIERGLVEEFEVESRYQSRYVHKEENLPCLQKDQKSVIEKVSFAKAHTYLLHGVTGSGKTEVYLRLAQKVINQGRSVLILVPEIALTPQMIDRVSKRFAKDVAIYHSALNNQEKYEQYMRVLNNEVPVVVGTRSAVFLPFKDLGLIVMDEEHDSSYKQSHTPYYHTRDIAIWRSEYHHCPLILGSASPDLGTYARALKGVYTLLEMPKRINDRFPTVKLVDTRQSLYKQESPYLTNTLLEEIEKRLAKKEQIMLLLNRRGYLPVIRNAETGQVLHCPYCDLALKYHKQEGLLKCHQCEYQTRKNPDNTALLGQGVGTERLMEALQEKVPHARIIRMDADTTRRKGSHERILNSFQEGEYDILIGTQMIAKGIDIENVTLMGIVDADSALVYDSYRSVEESFSMLLQAAGRSGRGRKEGMVLIQSFNPEHYAIVCAIHQKYKHFFKQEMAYRQLAQYPPYTYLIALVFSDEKLEKVERSAMAFERLLNHESLRIIGPTTLRRLSGKYRSRILLKGRDLEGMIQQVHQVMSLYQSMNLSQVIVDVNPLSIE